MLIKMVYITEFCFLKGIFTIIWDTKESLSCPKESLLKHL